MKCGAKTENMDVEETVKHWPQAVCHDIRAEQEDLFCSCLSVMLEGREKSI